jgi:hypothetical protein
MLFFRDILSLNIFDFFTLFLNTYKIPSETYRHGFRKKIGRVNKKIYIENLIYVQKLSNKQKLYKEERTNVHYIEIILTPFICIIS